MASKVAGYIVTMDLYRSTWHYFTRNPVGGGFGSNHCGSKKVALAKALSHIPKGSLVTVVTKHHGRVVGDPVTLKV